MEVAEKNKLKVPKLRFREFEGEWHLVKISNLGKVVTGSTPPTANRDYYDGDYSFVSPADIQQNRFVAQTKTTLTRAGFEKGRLIRKGGVLFVCIGSTIGKVGQAAVDCITNQQVNSVIANQSYYDDFVFPLLFRIGPRVRLLAGEQAVPMINKSEFSKIVVASPTLPEQKKIADFLSAVDARIALLNRKKEGLETYKKGVMQQLFAQELRFKRADGTDYPDWEEKRLGEVAVFAKGKGISKSDIDVNGTLPCIRYGELYTTYSETISDVYSATNISAEQLTLSKENDIIIPSSGETHIDLATASCVLKSGIALGGDLNIIRSKNNGVFLSYYLNSAKKLDIARMAQGNSVVHLYPSHLKNLKLNLPTKEEQQKIADFLSALDRKIEAVNAQLTHTQQFKKGLLQEMFV